MNKFLTKLHVVQRWIMTKCLTINPKASVIPRAAALTTATLTVTKAVQITSETSYVPSLPLLCCSSLVVSSKILVVYGCYHKSIHDWILKKIKLACAHT